MAYWNMPFGVVVTVAQGFVVSPMMHQRFDTFHFQGGWQHAVVAKPGFTYPICDPAHRVDLGKRINFAKVSVAG